MYDFIYGCYFWMHSPFPSFMDFIHGSYLWMRSLAERPPDKKAEALLANLCALPPCQRGSVRAYLVSRSTLVWWTILWMLFGTSLCEEFKSESAVAAWWFELTTSGFLSSRCFGVACLARTYASLVHAIAGTCRCMFQGYKAHTLHTHSMFPCRRTHV